MARVPKARLIPSYERYVLGVNSTVPAGLLEPEPDFPAINRGATVVVSLPGQGIKDCRFAVAQQRNRVALRLR